MQAKVGFMGRRWSLQPGPMHLVAIVFFTTTMKKKNAIPYNNNKVDCRVEPGIRVTLTLRGSKIA